MQLRVSTRWLALALCFGLCAAPLAHGQTTASLNDLSALLKRYESESKAGKYAAAEATAKQLVGIAEQNLQNRPDMRAQFLDLLADAYSHQERYADAQPLRQRAVELSERAYGKESVKLPPLLHALGDNYWNQEQREKAIPYYQRALAIRLKQLGAAHAETTFSRRELLDAYQRLGHYAEEEPLVRQELKLAEAQSGKHSAAAAHHIHVLANCLWNQGKLTESAAEYDRAAQVRERVLGADHVDTLFSRAQLAAAYQQLERYDDAERVRKEIVAAQEQKLGKDSTEFADALAELAALYETQSKYRDCEPIYRRVLAIREQAHGVDSDEVAATLLNLSYAAFMQGHYDDAVALDRRSVAIREKSLAADDPALAPSLASLGNALQAIGKLSEAETYHKRAVAIREQSPNATYGDLAFSLNALANLYRDIGRYAEGEALYKRALAIREEHLGADSLDVADTLVSLGVLYAEQGNYAAAEPLHRRALAIREQTQGPDGLDVASSVYTMAVMNRSQSRLAEAEKLGQRSLAIWERALGSEHPNVAMNLDLLGAICEDQKKYDEAEKLHQRALVIGEKLFGPEHADLAYTLHGLAFVKRMQEKFDEADKLARRALTLREKAYGADHPLVALSLYQLAANEAARGRDNEVEPLVDRAILSLDRVRGQPASVYACYKLRAEVAWRLGRKTEAVADLRRAMELAEQIRAQSAGAEHERAEHFGEYAGVFETMLNWQAELGNMGEAIAAFESSRARSLLDEMNLGGADVHIGRSPAERAELTAREANIKAQIAELEQQLGEAKTAADRQQLQGQLAALRQQLYDHYRNERSTSPVYRNLLSVGAGPPRLSQLQRQLTASQGLMLSYLFGEETGYLFITGPSAVRLVKLEVDATAAKALGITAGPLSQQRLQDALVRQDKQGVVQRLAASAKTAAPHAALHALWQVLIPAAEREELLAGKHKRLFIVPDGPLALLPFETLVTKPGDNPKYLLDAGPPLLYGPSATVLYNLAQRAAATAQADGQTVLAVGDPVYRAGAQNTNAKDIVAESRYAGLSGPLSPLPHTGLEAGWVVDVFGKRGIKANKLVQADATEANVRAGVAGRRIVHLACHGLTDQSYGNFFGALALTPGASGAENPADDGFLTLAEIYELNLRGCELAILSACETNYGPQQRGEGVWALSRGFLVAGSRRVVASNWLVDDEAAASLVSVFCEGLANGEKSGAATDYAAALQSAKRWVRQQEKWRSPYYWGTFVLVGPN